MFAALAEASVTEVVDMTSLIANAPAAETAPSGVLMRLVYLAPMAALSALVRYFSPKLPTPGASEPPMPAFATVVARTELVALASNDCALSEA